MATFAPAAANPMATPRPMPVSAPVTSTRLSLNLSCSLIALSETKPALSQRPARLHPTVDVRARPAPRGQRQHLVHHRPARRINQDRVRLHLAQLSLPDQMISLLGQRAV